MEEKKKRVVTRIGDIFCVEIDGKYKSYFQYVTKDVTELGSPVIRVFKKRYPIDYLLTMEEIVNDEVSFYAHTFIRAGLYFNAWYKVGSCKEVGDVENIYFKYYTDVNWGLTGQTKSYNWWIWKVNQEHIKIGEMKKQYKHYHLGPVLSYSNIVEKIKTGKFLFRVLV